MPLVLLDRDGVINRDSPGTIRDPRQWRAIAGSLEAIARLSEGGWAIGVCTNQSGLGRGLISQQDLEAIHTELTTRIAALGGRVDGLFVCPHTDDDGCDCRKPAPGLIHQACRALGHDPQGVPFIGDSGRDLEAARRAGARPILVLTGNGRATLAAGKGMDCERYDDLASAADALMAEARRGRG